jgi:uncharacterized membrane protein YgcG
MWLNAFWYRLIGPTTVHLQYEFYLLCSLFLLTISSLQGLYKDDLFTTRGDYIFLAFQCVWLAKHLLLRIVCVWDVSTSRCPTLRGFLSHFVTSYLTGGQVFDRPTPKAMARQLGATDSSYTGGGGGRHHQGGGGGGGGSNAAAVLHSNNVSSSLPPTLAYLVQIFKISIWFPLAHILDPPPFALLKRRRLQQQRLLLQQQQSNKRSLSHHIAPELTRSTSRGSAGGGGGSSGSGSSVATAWLGRFLHFVATHGSIIWNNAPSVQLCWAWSATIFCMYNFFLYDVLQEPPVGPSALYNSGYNTAVKNEEDSMKRSGYLYRPTLYVPATIYSLFTLNVQFILALSLLYFSRVILPIPDQIAGGNILRDARQEAKAAPKQTSSSSFSSSYAGSGGSSSASSGGVGFLTSLVSKWFYPMSYSGTSTSSSSKRSSDHHHGHHQYSNSADLPWTEKNRPIVTQSRWRVHALVLSIRLVDVWLSCGILPRTNSACYVMGHCPTTTRDATMAEMAHFLYPVGITKALRDDIGYNPASAAAGTTSGVFAPSSSTSSTGNLKNGWMAWLGSWMSSWWWSSPIAETLMGKTQIQDSFSAIWITIDLIVIPLVLLCSQALVLNRSYLAMASYFSTEWTWIGPERSNRIHSSCSSSNSRGTGSIQQLQQVANATVWDPRRKYKKDDVVVYGKNLYRAAFDQPEGRPCDESASMPLILRIFGLPFFLASALVTGCVTFHQFVNGDFARDGRKKTRSSSSSSSGSSTTANAANTTTAGFTRSANGFLQNALRNELGHPQTSDVICMGSVVLFVLTIIHLAAWLWFTMWNLSNSDGLFCAVAANLIACYAVVSVGSTKYSELNQLNREILAAANK